MVAITAGTQARQQRDVFAAQLEDALARERRSAIERDALRRQIIESGERIAELNADVENLKITRFEAKRECHSIKTSLSWRVTWPLRVLRDEGMAFVNKLRHWAQPLRGTLTTAIAVPESDSDSNLIKAIFDERYYPEQTPSLGTLTTAIAVPESDSDSNLIKAIFDERYYLEQTPSLVSAGILALQHYQTIGWREGRNPHPLFNTGWYLKNNPDVAALGCEPLEHYCRYGWCEGLCPGPLFDSVWYLKAYQDIANAGMEPLTHYLQHGIAEGRFPRSIDKELAELPDRHFARWAAEHCTRFLSQTFERELIEPLRKTAIKELGEALVAARIEKVPDVSVIVAAHNKLDFTLSGVTAVLMSSSRRSFEIIVADDASNDETRSIFEKLPKPVRYVRWDRNQGFSRSCNAAAEYANGRYLVFLDSDTIVFRGGSIRSLIRWRSNMMRGL